jgi:hypothetical protein
MRTPLAIIGIVLAVGLVGAIPPPAPSLAERVQKADLVFVGKLEPWSSRKMLPVQKNAQGGWTYQYVTVNLRVQTMLKGATNLTIVPIRFGVGYIESPENREPSEFHDGGNGVWILTHIKEHYSGDRFPLKQEAEIAKLLLVTTTGAQAELCVKCKDSMFTQEIGKCVECGGTTSSGAFKLCKTCSAKLDQCEHCRAALTPSASKQAVQVQIGKDARGK